jgi:ferredoxin/flavodoxin
MRAYPLKPEIYYFSGTGNSLVVARNTAAKIGGEIIAIPAINHKTSINPDADTIGLVFPVYHGGFPLIVQRFIEKLTFLEGKYIFGVCTFGDSPGLAMEYLDKLVSGRGGKLAGGFGVHMPYNYITPTSLFKDFLSSFSLREIPPEKQQILFADAFVKIGKIAAYVNARKSGLIETDSAAITRLVDAVNLHETLGKSIWLKIGGVTEPTNLPFRESIQLMDRSFQVDDNCTGCGTCSLVCPVNNIELIENKPQWRQHCEQCFACLQWCPQEAIQFGKKTAGKTRYHHPDVKLDDMVFINN